MAWAAPSNRSRTPASTWLNRGATTLVKHPTNFRSHGRPSPLAAQAFRDEVVLVGLMARRPVTRADIFEGIAREVVAGLEF